jgi:hypothetical protein
MDIVRSVKKLGLFLLIFTMLTGAFSCALTKKNSRYERPKKGKMKPCDCPGFGLNKIYDADVSKNC